MFFLPLLLLLSIPLYLEKGGADRRKKTPFVLFSSGAFFWPRGHVTSAASWDPRACTEVWAAPLEMEADSRVSQGGGGWGWGVLHMFPG